MKTSWTLTLCVLCLALLYTKIGAHDEHLHSHRGSLRMLLHEGHAHSPASAPTPSRRLLHEGHEDTSEGVLAASAPAPGAAFPAGAPKRYLS